MKFDEYFKLKDLTLNITNGCNLRCSYCYAVDKNAQKMSCEDACKIVDKCYHNYELNKQEGDEEFAVSFFGGEPFTNFEVMEAVLKHSREKGYNISFGVTTNMTILDDHMIDVIEEYELGMLISIDGVKEIHDRNRCNSYDTVKDNIKKLLDRGLGYLLEARVTVMPKDVTQLVDSVKSIYEMGISSIAPVCVTDTKWEEQDFVNFEENLDKLWEWVFNLYNDSENHNNLSVKMIEDYLEKVLLVPLNDYETKVCSAGSFTSCSIGVNGDILPCHQRHTVKYGYNNLVMGNILEDTDVKEIEFNNYTIKGAYDCEDCVAKAICKGGCPSENYTYNGDGNTQNETQCLITIIMVNAAIKYQQYLLTSPNIRSHRLNVLVENLSLMGFLFEKVLTKEPFSQDFISGLTQFYEKLLDAETILLPAFRNAFDTVIKDLVNISSTLLPSEDDNA